MNVRVTISPRYWKGIRKAMRKFHNIRRKIQMTDEQLQKAKDLKRLKVGIEEDLKALERNRLGTEAMDRCGHFGYRPLGHVPEKISQSFKEAATNALKLRLLDIDKEFKEL